MPGLIDNPDRFRTRSRRASRFSLTADETSSRYARATPVSKLASSLVPTRVPPLPVQLQGMTMHSSSRIANPRFVDAGANNFRSQIAVPVGRAKTPFIDVRDIATVAVRVVTEAGHKNKCYTLTGSEALDYDEVAARLTTELGRKVRYTNPVVTRPFKISSATGTAHDQQVRIGSNSGQEIIMATRSSPLQNFPPQPTSAATRGNRLLYRVGQLFLTILLVLVSLIVALPILLLFVATLVSGLISVPLALAYVAIVIALFRLARTPTTIALAIMGMMALSVLAVVFSQRLASTPPISDARGQLVPNSIASLEPVTLGGTEQWITIRGHDTRKPVLLFLAGGPGGSELVMTRRYLGELEQHFVVVNWDQPGAGRSYNAVDISTLTPERFVSDAHELTQYLRERFHQEKIYVLGESWGSIVGIMVVQQHPDLFYAFISSGQMVNTTENDVMGYEFAITYLTQEGKSDQLEALRGNGPPPYTGNDRATRFLTLSNVLYEYMHANAHGEGVNHNLLFDSLLAPEYGLLDKVNWVRGLSDVFTTVYPQIADLEFRTQATRIEVPVYFIVGRWDVNAMTSLTEEYFAILEAPHKALIWFENSAHTPLWDEPDHFVDVMVNTVLAQTLSPASGE